MKVMVKFYMAKTASFALSTFLRVKTVDYVKVQTGVNIDIQNDLYI